MVCTNLTRLPRGHRAQLSQAGSSPGAGETGENRHGPPAWLPAFIVSVVPASVKPEDPWVLSLDTALNCV